jgi:hypothetical protein
LRERQDIVRVVITVTQLIGTEIDNLVSRLAELSDQLFFQIKSTVIRGNPDAHVSPSVD